MYNPAPPTYGIPGTVRTPGAGGTGAAEHGSGAGYACQASADRLHMAMAADPSMVPQARQATRNAMASWRLAHIADETELIVSELVTNAVRASSTASVVALYLALDLDRLYVMVWDDSPKVPVSPPPADDDSESGRGLGIVETLSDRCGTVIIERGKIVWSRISTTT